MKIPEHLYAVIHTKACQGSDPEFQHPVSMYVSLTDASWSRERECKNLKGRAYGCRLIRYDRQVEKP